MAVGDKWLGDADRKEHWRDTMVKVTGPPAASLQSAFAPLWPIRLASHRYYEEMMEAGIRIYEYQATMIHTKSVIVDGKWSIVGSANMDIRSTELNMENVCGVLDAGFAGELEAAFRKDLEKSKEIKLEEWRRRGAVRRVLERVCALFAEQY